MDHQKQILRTGAVVIVLAIILRLSGGGFFVPFVQIFDQRGVLSFWIYLQTGRVIRFPEAVDGIPAPDATEPQITAPPETQPQEHLPVFSQTDLENVSVTYGCSYRPDLQSLLQQPLQWNLTRQQPTVLIVHTHATEAYTQAPGEWYVEDGAYRTLDDHYNMVSIGDEVVRVLEAGGIQVIHDRRYHDYPSYNGSYSNAREAIKENLQKYPSIQLVLDIHRDASDGADGNQLSTQATVAGQPSAQLMVVVGTDATGNHHPDWQENLALGLKLSAVLEQEDPGITRPINLRQERFNMDLTPGSLLVEIGAAGDTHGEAMLAANALARGILTLARGTS